MNRWLTWVLISLVSFNASWLAAKPNTNTNGSLPKVLVLGDSLSAAYNLKPEEGWVSLMANRLKGKARVVNASISGETTSGGLTRLPALLAEHQPNLIILELGANDGLRGLPLAVIHKNLEELIQLSLAAKAKVIIAGIYLPPNYGANYTRNFAAIYPNLANKYSLPYLPFLLNGVADKPNLMQNDGLHPTAEAQPIILENLWPYITGFFN